MKRIQNARNNTCGRRVKLARIEEEMTQSDLAAVLNMKYRIEITTSGVSDLENGRRFVKDFEIIALADVLYKHPMWLLFGDKIPEKYK